MMKNYRQNFEAFCRLFNNDRSIIIPLISVNVKTAEDLQKITRQLIDSLTVLTRIHYIIQSPKNFELFDFVHPLKDFKMVNIATALRLFSKPNHKDRFTHMIHFVTQHPEIFAQITYLNALQLDRDDACYFCSVTFPSIYLFFLTESDQKSALAFLEAILKLHIYLHSKKFGPPHQFIKDLIFGYFLTTNPGRFFQNSIDPLIPKVNSYIRASELKYKEKPLFRHNYWTQIINFVETIVDKMISAVPLLPFSAKCLIKLLSDHFSGISLKLFGEIILCRFIENFIDHQGDNVLKDSAKIIKEKIGIQTNLPCDVKLLVKSSKIHIDKLLVKICSSALKNNQIDLPSQLSDAMDISGHSTLITCRSLTMIFRFVKHFHRFANDDQKSIVGALLSGVDEPKEPNDELKYIQLKVNLEDTSFNILNMKPTQPYDDIVDIINTIDLGNCTFNTPEELQTILYNYCEMRTTQKQMLSVKNLTNFEAVLFKTGENRKKLAELNRKFSSALFATQNELNRNLEQQENLSVFLMNSQIFPILSSSYPPSLSFFYHGDMFSPKSHYRSLIEAAQRITSKLGLLPFYEKLFQKKIILDFVDQIDTQFGFQVKVKSGKVPILLAEFCKMNSHLSKELSPQKQINFGRAAIEFQFVLSEMRVSSNLAIILNALKKLESFPDDAIMLSVAMSGNASLFGTIYFAGSYVKDTEIQDIVFNESENMLFAKLKKVIQVLHGNLPYKVDL